MIAGIVLSVALLALAPVYWRRRGPASGLRWVALGLVPAALALSGLATMLGRIGVAIGRFASSFVFSPTVWLGFGLLGGAVLLELGSRALRARGAGGAPAVTPGPASAARKGAAPAQPTPQVGQPKPQVARAKPAADDDFDEIEALLRKRGIS